MRNVVTDGGRGKYDGDKGETHVAEMLEVSLLDHIDNQTLRRMSDVKVVARRES